MLNCDTISETERLILCIVVLTSGAVVVAACKVVIAFIEQLTSIIKEVLSIIKEIISNYCNYKLLELTTKHPDTLKNTDQVVRVKKYTEAMKKSEESADEPPPVDANGNEKIRNVMLQSIQGLQNQNK